VKPVNKQTSTAVNPILLKGFENKTNPKQNETLDSAKAETLNLSLKNSLLNDTFLSIFSIN